ncbi:YceI family protein [Persicobacter psychrovividus]|uniref:Lipid/polyisoprenoid-binding YceI-like domain-containing protein n=1 Tax=Persicobacter psychrovividus TaxID=387638 RepID=A0ABM7VI81_9BACT|nr:hypothetical protein PEPS_29600 [Persicobacter psychrovividus]
MNFKINKQLFVFALIALLSVSKAWATEYEIIIKGVSNVHDWECKVEKADVNIDVQASNGSIEALNGATLTVPVKSIKSGKSGMDKNIYKALKESKHAEIAFEMKNVKSVDGKTITVQGDLRIAGVTNAVDLNAELVTIDGKNAIKGQQVISMKDYEVEAPTAMFGAITTEDEVTVEYTIYL